MWLFYKLMFSTSSQPYSNFDVYHVLVRSSTWLLRVLHVSYQEANFRQLKHLHHHYFSRHLEQAKLVLGPLCNLGVAHVVHANAEQNRSLGSFAYHLYKLSSNWFSYANGKQPMLRYSTTLNC